MRVAVEVRSIDQGCALPPFSVRLRDLSVSGAAILLTGKQQLSKEFVIRLSFGGGRSVTLLCDCRRATAFDGSCTVISAMFLKMMLPGQLLRDNMPITTVNWHTFKLPVPTAA